MKVPEVVVAEINFCPIPLAMALLWWIVTRFEGPLLDPMSRAVTMMDAGIGGDK
jgi:hypothetical protein